MSKTKKHKQDAIPPSVSSARVEFAANGIIKAQRLLSMRRHERVVQRVRRERQSLRVPQKNRVSMSALTANLRTPN